MSRPPNNSCVNWDDMIKRYNNNESIRSLSKRCRAAPSTIYNMLVRFDVKMRSKSEAQNNYLKTNDPQPAGIFHSDSHTRLSCRNEDSKRKNKTAEVANDE